MKKFFLLVLSLAVAAAFLPSMVLAAVSAPRLLTPGNGAKDYHSSVTRLSWTKIPGATSYELAVKDGSTDFSGVSPISLDSNYILANQANIQNNGHVYYWKVRAKIGSEESAWSQVFKFTTSVKPAAATALYPNNLTFSKTNPKDFSWKADRNNIFGEVTFYLFLNGSCTDQKFTSFMAYKGTKISLSLFLSTIAPGTYCWSVKTYGNATAGDELESVKAKFTLTDFNSAPNLTFISPGFGETIFYWQKTTDSNFTVQVSKNANFPVGGNTVEATGVTTNYLLSSSAPATFKDFINNNPNVDLYCRVGVNGAWSRVQKFKNVGLSKPALIYPATNALNFVATSSVFKWGKVNSASFYKLTIEKASDNSLKTYYSSAPTYKMPVNLASTSGNFWSTSTDYIWRVTAYNDSTESTSSDPFYFKTK
ncbi:MAG: hypothetical protein WC523_01870 [Patescibacteria group bacterium]|jgi:hypothetical protein